MKAARLHGVNDIRIEDVPELPAPEGDEVLLAVEAAGICGSDLHNFHTGMWMSRTPSTPGHEFVATVVATGPEVRWLATGDRVIADSRVPCGICPACRSGRAYLCPSMGFVGEVNDGGFAPRTIQPERQLIRLADQNLPPEIAVLAEPLAVALHAVNRLGLSPKESVLVNGAGTIGALVVAVLAHRGYANVQVSDINDKRRDGVCDAFGVHPSDPSTDPVDGLIDTTGAAAAFTEGLRRVRRGGHVAVVGLYRGPFEVDMNAIVEGGLTLAGCAAFDTELLDAVSDLSAMQPLLARLPTETITLEDLPAAYDSLLGGRRDVQKVMVAFDRPAR